jgi:hypothetical protein
LALLSGENIWQCDGTFKVAPKLFTQLFTVGTVKNGYFLPLAYFLLPDKKKESYAKAFRYLLKHTRPPKVIACDFEQGIMVTACEIFNRLLIFACWFHLLQNLRL